MSDRTSTVRLAGLAAMVVLVAACPGDSPTALDHPDASGEWEATYSVSVPDCNFAFSQVVPVTINETGPDSHVSLTVDYAGLGGCVLVGSRTGSTISAAAYRCFPFGLSCPGESVECSGNRRLALCRVGIVREVEASFAANSGVGTYRAGVPIVAPGTGRYEGELGATGSITFRRLSG